MRARQVRRSTSSVLRTSPCLPRTLVSSIARWILRRLQQPSNSLSAKTCCRLAVTEKGTLRPKSFNVLARFLTNADEEEAKLASASACTRRD
ncbi:hypothetical protein BM43_7430 (plasmid) [Burkholderia gladioli]|nr:hypothetical protein BM43_7430 [Burkholderia gladioli]